MIVNENGMSTYENKEEILPNENGRFQCKYCNQTRSSKSLLKRHLKKSCKGVKFNHEKKSCKGVKFNHEKKSCKNRSTVI